MSFEMYHNDLIKYVKNKRQNKEKRQNAINTTMNTATKNQNKSNKTPKPYNSNTNNNKPAKKNKSKNQKNSTERHMNSDDSSSLDVLYTNDYRCRSVNSDKFNDIDL